MPGKIPCPKCGRKYTWKESLAGKKVRCKDCESVFTFDTAPPVEQNAAADSNDEYELNIDEPTTSPQMDGGGGGYDINEDQLKRDTKSEVTDYCPSCGVSITFGAVLCVNCGYHLKEGRQLDTEHGEPITDSNDETDPEKPTPLRRRPGAVAMDEYNEQMERHERLTGFTIPIILIAVGFAMAILKGLFLYDPTSTGGTLPAIGRVLFTLASIIVSVPAMLIGIMIAARLLDLTFGTLGTALLKLTAIAIAPGVIWDIVSFCLGGGLFGAFFGMIASGIAYWILIVKLFDMDASDAIKVILIIFFVRMFVVYFVTMMMVWMLI